MLFDIISTIEVSVTKYAYSVTPNGMRDIDSEHPEEETLMFKFDSMSIEYIIFREGPPVLRVDDKVLHFGMKQNSLRSIHFENENFLWIVKDPKGFLAQCREVYLRQKITERFLGIMDQTKPNSDKEELSEILDEFEVSGKLEESSDEEDYLDG